MQLSLMTFSMMADKVKFKLNADKLVQVAVDSKVPMIDIMDMELKIYGKDKVKKALSAKNIKVGCLIASMSFYAKPENVEKEAKEALELAKEMDTDILMVIPGQPLPADVKKVEHLGKQAALDLAVSHFKMIVEMAKPYGIQIGFENTPQAHKPLASPEDCQYLLDHVSGLGLIFDTGNFRVADSHCDELAIYEQLKKYIIRVHLKDVVVGDFDGMGEACVDGKKILPVTTGAGVIPMKELLERLKTDGYKGDLAVEYSEKKGVGGLDNAIWIAPYVSYTNRALAGEIENPPYAAIPGIGTPVSRIFFGTAMMPLLLGKDAEYLFDAMVSCGVNAFDTARGYGMAEKSLGNWMKNRNNRDRIVILSKCGNVGIGGKVCVNREVIEKELDVSLKTLQTDYIDIYLLHRDDPNTPVDEIIDTLNEAKRAGKIKIFGASNWTDARIREANTYAASKGLEGFSVSSPNYGLTITKSDPWGGDCVSIAGPGNEESRQWYAEQGMPIIAYSSLGRGFFSGKFKSGDYESAKKVLDSAAQKGYLCEENMERLRRAEELADKYDTTVSQIAMRYVFASDMNIFAIVSTSKGSRMLENVYAANHPLSKESVAYLESV